VRVLFLLLKLVLHVTGSSSRVCAREKVLNGADVYHAHTEASALFDKNLQTVATMERFQPKTPCNQGPRDTDSFILC
jgi:hypothetical protein